MPHLHFYSIMVAAKFLDDFYYSNEFWAKVIPNDLASCRLVAFPCERLLARVHILAVRRVGRSGGFPTESSIR